MASPQYDPADDLAHHVPPQAFMSWKENWCFTAVDPGQRIGALFLFSMRPSLGEGIFNGKFCIDGWEHRYVGRSPIPRQLEGFHPVEDERLSLEILEPDTRYRVRYRSDELDADLEFTGRFPTFDYSDGNVAPGDSPLGLFGRLPVPYKHHEQGLAHTGTLTVKAGPHAGRTFTVSGWGNRDHSWGWRDDLTFVEHVWLCANFEDRYVQGMIMHEEYYRHGPKTGGSISTDAALDPVVEIVPEDPYWMAQGVPLPVLDRDVRLRVRTQGGETCTVAAHLERDYARLYLNARSGDRKKVYQDVVAFTDFTLVDTGQVGSGVLELGKLYVGDDAADVTARSASRT